MDMDTPQTNERLMAGLATLSALRATAGPTLLRFLIFFLVFFFFSLFRAVAFSVLFGWLAGDVERVPFYVDRCFLHQI